MRRTLTALVCAAALAACSGDDDPTPPETDGEAVEEATPASADPIDRAHLDSGVQIVVTDVRATDTVVVVDVAGWNGSTDEVGFAVSEPELTDNADNRYLWLPPDTNRELRAQPGEIVRAQLVFEVEESRNEEEETTTGSRFHLELNRFSGRSPQAEFVDLAPRD